MNTSMKTVGLLLFMACLQALPAASQQITKERAVEKAKRFMGTVQVGNMARGDRRADVRLTLASNSEDYFIFNDERNGGYVIVGGDERQRDVLGYSPDGHFDAGKVPCNLQSLLDDYAKQAEYLRAHPGYAAPEARRAGGIAVDPLLKCTWGQGAPYYNMCPVIGGMHCLTGCVATAAAQIMYHHQWPERGTGQISYDWEGQTLSADFSQSVYRWDLMLPSYDENSSIESQDAVALLLKDVGYAFSMIYGLGDSGASFRGEPFVDFFDYDLSARLMERESCSLEDWNGILEDELKNGRPVLLSGGSPGGAHTMVVDGCDGNGYFHFNFGWDGKINGFFATSEISFNLNQLIIYGIKRNEGGRPLYAFGSSDDFVYQPEYGLLHFNDWIKVFGINRYNGLYYSALAVENKTTHETVYSKEYQWGKDYNLVIDLPDGDYMVYPVARVNRDDEWQRVMFRDNRQAFVDLNVTNGEMTFSNNHIFNGLQDGAYEIDGIYYFLDFETHEATVTFKNDKYASYVGDVTIPGHINYEGSDFTVTTIGDDAFKDSNFGVLTIPNTVKAFKTAFDFSQVEKLVFEEGSSLETIGGLCFNSFGVRDMELNLPEGLTRLPSHIFQSSLMSWVSLPSTLTTIEGTPFNYSWNLRTIVANNRTPIPLNPTFFVGVDWSLCTLYVPKGTKDSYASADTWKDFGIIKEMEDTVTVDGVKYILHDNDLTATVMSGYFVKQNEFTLPSEISYKGKAYKVSEIGCFSFVSGPIEMLTIPSTVSYFGEACFNDIYYDFNIKQLSLYHEDPPEVADMKHSGKEGFKPLLLDGYFNSVELHVPMGCKSKYESHSFWGKFKNIVDDKSLDINTIASDADGLNRQAIYTISGMKLNGVTDVSTLPKGIYIQGKKVIVK